MHPVRRCGLAALLALASLAPLAPPSPVPSPVAAAHALTARVPAARTATPERAWGVIGAITCGIAIKLLVSTGPNTAVIAVAVGACALAALDVLTTEE